MLSLSIPAIMMAIVACPGVLVDNISVFFHPASNGVQTTMTLTCFAPVAGNIVEFQWDFGDGNTATSTNNTITHTYALNGSFTVTCKALTTQTVMPFTKMVTTPDITFSQVTETLDLGGPGLNANCAVATTASSAVDDSSILFGSREQGVTITGGGGFLIVDSIALQFENRLQIDVDPTCSAEYFIIYPDDFTNGGPFAATPVNVSASSGFYMPLTSMTGSMKFRLQLSDGTTTHQETLTISSAQNLIFDMSDYAAAGVDLVNVRQLKLSFVANGNGAISANLPAPFGFLP
jgi:hypothetical protein